jgi:hypothetical protein
MLLKRILRKYDRNMWIGLIWLRGRTGDGGGGGGEPSGSINEQLN